MENEKRREDIRMTRGLGERKRRNNETGKQESEDRLFLSWLPKKYCPSILHSQCPLLEIPGCVPFGALGVVELIINCEFVGS